MPWAPTTGTGRSVIAPGGIFSMPGHAQPAATRTWIHLEVPAAAMARGPGPAAGCTGRAAACSPVARALPSSHEFRGMRGRPTQPAMGGWLPQAYLKHILQ